MQPTKIPLEEGLKTHEEEKAMEPSQKRKKQEITMPKKSKFRMRAHINPLSEINYPRPLSPDHVDWSIHYPLFFGGNTDQNLLMFDNTTKHPVTYPDTPAANNGRVGKAVEIVDCGCGYGGLLIRLAEFDQSTLMLGMEIRPKVVNFVTEKIRVLRYKEDHKKFNNIAILRTNIMKNITNYFRKGQLSKMYFCFPDPHFKKQNFRRRIINENILSEYAFLLKEGGMVYTITDVKDLFDWNVKMLDSHPMFQRIPDEQLKDDKYVDAMIHYTDESKKVTRKGGDKYWAVYKKVTL